jgi:hypothetical protein
LPLLIGLEQHNAHQKSHDSRNDTCPQRECEQDEQHAKKAAGGKGLAYQTMHTVGIRQSISLARGYLDYAWLAQVQSDLGQGIINFWRSLLAVRDGENLDEQEYLLDSLRSHRIDAWMAHLHDRAQRAYRSGGTKVRLYSVNEVRKMTAMMNSTTNHPLRNVLEREEGTLGFGRALRLLGREKPEVLRDLLDLLGAVQTLYELIRALHRVVQECSLAKAHYKFIHVPEENDLIPLFEDVHQHGPRLIAGLLMLLSALRYPSADDGDHLSTQLSSAEESEGATPAESLHAVPDSFETFSFEGGQERYD